MTVKIREGEGWLIGHAARTNHVFSNGSFGRQMFTPGCFGDLTRVVFGVDHGCCTCRTAGQDARVDPALVLADTTAGTLFLQVDAYGLFFAARVPLDATVQHGDDAPIAIHAAIAAGRCRGVSIHFHDAARLLGRPEIPSDVLAFGRMRLVEISLCLTMPPMSPGTWVAPASEASWAELHRRANAAAAQLRISEEPCRDM